MRPTPPQQQQQRYLPSAPQTARGSANSPLNVRNVETMIFSLAESVMSSIAIGRFDKENNTVHSSETPVVTPRITPRIGFTSSPRGHRCLKLSQQLKRTEQNTYNYYSEAEELDPDALPEVPISPMQSSPHSYSRDGSSPTNPKIWSYRTRYNKWVHITEKHLCLNILARFSPRAPHPNDNTFQYNIIPNHHPLDVHRYMGRVLQGLFFTSSPREEDHQFSAEQVHQDTVEHKQEVVGDGRQRVFDEVAAYTISSLIGKYWIKRAEPFGGRDVPRITFSDVVVVESPPPSGGVQAMYSDVPQCVVDSNHNSTNHRIRRSSHVSIQVLCAEVVSAFMHFSFIKTDGKYVVYIESMDALTLHVRSCVIVPKSSNKDKKSSPKCGSGDSFGCLSRPEFYLPL
eukprot:PhF_6_TR7045/c0_g1_i2/m.10587